MPFTAFAIAASQNTGGKNDATGAFIPGAQKFSAAYGCSFRLFDNTGSSAVVRKRFLDTIANHCPGGTQLFAYFGHGIRSGLPSACCYGGDLDDFVKVLLPKIVKPFVAVFYACSAGAPQGFTGQLRAKLGADVWVYGHITPGHSFMNPDVSEEASGNSPTYRIMYGEGNDLRSPWADALKYTDLWLRFPLMEDDDINAELNVRRLLGKWEVSASAAVRHYQFDSPVTAWTVRSGRDIAAPPTGTVKNTDPRKPSSVIVQGAWQITDRLYVNWPSGTPEIWPLPLRVTGQQGMAGASPINARRISRPQHHGILQG